MARRQRGQRGAWRGWRAALYNLPFTYGNNFATTTCLTSHYYILTFKRTRSEGAEAKGKALAELAWRCAAGAPVPCAGGGDTALAAAATGVRGCALALR